jgi:pimeloyl-ACP methyl ester carboxylesterase
VPGYAAHLQGALAQLGVTRAHLVLHDFGGPWGLQWAVDHPDAHASTTLINPPALPLDYADRMFDMYADKGTRRAVLRLYRATEIEPHVAAIAPRLRENPRPTLVAWGGKDPYLKVRLAQRQREVFRDATVIELPDSGHWSLADDPQAVLNAVVPFLRDQVAGAVPLRD